MTTFDLVIGLIIHGIVVAGLVLLMVDDMVIRSGRRLQYQLDRLEKRMKHLQMHLIEDDEDDEDDE